MKAGRWTRIQQFVNRHLPNYSAGFSRLRGLAVPLDLFLTGRVRFARKIGEFLPLIQPDNASDLLEDLLDNGRVAVLDEPIRWVQYGSLMRLLAHDKDVNVLNSLIETERLPMEVLEILANSKHAEIRDEAEARLEARLPTKPKKNKK
jgi:hypothetical protein